AAGASSNTPTSRWVMTDDSSLHGTRRHEALVKLRTIVTDPPLGGKCPGEGSDRAAVQAGRSFLNGDGVGRGRGGVGFAQDEDEVAVAHADLVAGTQAGRAGDLGAVEEGAVLGSRVVEFGAVAGMDQDGTVTTRNETILDDHVVIGRAADGVESDFERVN